VQRQSGAQMKNKVITSSNCKIAIALGLALLSPDASASAPKVAVFDFELVDTSLEGAANGPRADEAARLSKLGVELRHRLIATGRIDVVDIAPVAAQAHASNLQACGGCDASFARELGARLSITGWVQKVSNLILNVNIVVRDADSGRVISGKSVDMRGNTDESWSRALDWLVRNYLLDPRRGVF
jgi:Protein of unknown function (DUF2380)